MPLYEYRCNQCDYRFERIQKFNAQPDTVCPKCGGDLYRPLSAPALQFKGSGWYVNDYPHAGGGSNGSSPAPEKPASDAAKPAASESKPPESQPASDAPAKPAAASGTTT